MGSTRSTSGTASEHEGRLAVLGVGSIAEAIVTGLSASDPKWRIVLSPRNPARSARLAAAHPNVSVATSNQAALDAADTVLLCLRAADAPVLAELSFRPEQRLISVMPSPCVNDLAALVGRVAAISRAIPAVAVADRAGLTPVYPAGSAAQTLFDELGGSMALASEQQLDATSAASATVATYFALLQAIAEWLAGRGVDERQARRLVAAVFAGASAELAHSSDFAELAAQHATPGGQNERLVARLRAAGMFGQLTDGLDALLAE